MTDTGTAAVPVTLTTGPTPFPSTPPDPLVGPLARPPRRRPGSVRRTTTVECSWPEGQGTPMHMDGRARDLRTNLDGTTTVLAHDTMRVRMSLMRSIEEISVSPDRPRIGELVGAQAGKGLRGAIDAAVPDERGGHTPLGQLLDDVAGASLVGGFAWSRHRDNWMGGYGAPPPAPVPAPTTTESADAPSPPPQIRRGPMVGTCAGYAPGSSALAPDGLSPSGQGQSVQQVPPLLDPFDPVGFHELESLPEVAMRRCRRIDVWREGDVYRIDSHFRDACADPNVIEVAVHEYSMYGTIDARTLTITELVAVPRILPYLECPNAAPQVAWLVGESLPELRSRVLKLLKGVDCCTHLNDALRALADIVALVPEVREPVDT